ncbi:uncharacterized protein LOC122244873 [Penaeus japonicus]|uniref:uncharacterized protein LOC122244873 n=1 Tax=Penaeus japonicus TaxID=27405 RepID=UPI001C70E770|nr:uncharacterized protein LOC122244873 [Penaeus japonicus]
MLVQTSLPVNASLLVASLIFLVYYTSCLQDAWSRPTCVQECLQRYFEGPISVQDPHLISLVRDEYLVPPPEDPDRTPLDIYQPPWRKLLDWSTVQENLKEIWQDQPPGTFVEVGAVDGDFMSQTLLLEKNLSWTGLLLEPDPRSFKILQERRRNAWTSPLCVLYNTPSQKKYWLRDLEMDLPEHFLQLLMARSKLEDDTPHGGKCAPGGGGTVGGMRIVVMVMMVVVKSW